MSHGRHVMFCFKTGFTPETGGDAGRGASHCDSKL